MLRSRRDRPRAPPCRHAPGIWRRYLHLVLDGLRTPERGPFTPPPLTTKQLAETVAASRR